MGNVQEVVSGCFLQPQSTLSCIFWQWRSIHISSGTSMQTEICTTGKLGGFGAVWGVFGARACQLGPPNAFFQISAAIFLAGFSRIFQKSTFQKSAFLYKNR